MILLFTPVACLFLGFRSTPSPSPYATALLPLNHAHSQQNGLATTESVYAKPDSVCPSRVSYYASSQLTQVSIVCVHCEMVRGFFLPCLSSSVREQKFSIERGGKCCGKFNDIVPGKAVEMVISYDFPDRN